MSHSATRIRARAPIKLRSHLQPSSKSLLQRPLEQALAHVLPSHAYGEHQIRQNGNSKPEPACSAGPGAGRQQTRAQTLLE